MIRPWSRDQADSNFGKATEMFWISIRSIVLLGLGLEIGFSQAQAQDSEMPYKIVFFGDSITEAAVGSEGYIAQLKTSLQARHPNRKFELIGAGISGHKVPDLLGRVDRDVLQHDPDLVVIYIGINDVWHSQSNQGTPADKYLAGLSELVTKIKSHGAGVILCTPSVIGELSVGENKLDAMLDQYAESSRTVARQTGICCVDLRTWFLHDLKIRNPENKPHGVLTTDGVHLNRAGNELVKDCLLGPIESIASAGSVRHLVLVQFKASTTVADINRVSDAFAGLQSQIDAVSDFEAGQDISPEQLAQGYTHCYLLTFRDSAARDAYLVHPAHEAFKQLAIPHVEKVLVVDIFGK